MCGIVGGINLGAGGFSDHASDVMYNLLMVSTLRGTDGTGLAIGGLDNPSNIQVKKEAFPVPYVVGMKGLRVRLKQARWVIGHTRAATVGEVVDAACHPFSHGEVVGVHNGTARSIFSAYPDIEKGVNDSDHIYKALARAEPEDATDVLINIGHGAYALVWYDSRIKSLRFVRNSSRPLYFTHKAPYIFWASEPWFLDMALNRQYTKPKYQQPWQIKTHTLVTLPMNGKPMEVQEYSLPKPAASKGGAGKGIHKIVSVTELYLKNQRKRQQQSVDAFTADDGCLWSYDVDSDTWVPSGRAESFEGIYPTPYVPPPKTERAPSVPAWHTLESAASIWEGPDWLKPYKHNVYRACEQVLGAPFPVTRAASKVSLDKLAKQSARFDPKSRKAQFVATKVVSGTGFVYGLLQRPGLFSLPAVGLMAGECIKKYKADASSEGTYPLFMGNIDSLRVWADGSIGVVMHGLDYDGRTAKNFTLDTADASIGGEFGHPHHLLTSDTSMIDWEIWRDI